MGRYNKRSRFSGFSGRAATFSWHHPKMESGSINKMQKSQPHPPVARFERHAPHRQAAPGQLHGCAGQLVKLQDSAQYECYFFIADLHALTTDSPTRRALAQYA